MTLTLDLSPEAEAQLLAEAAAAGTPPAQWAAQALAELLAREAAENAEDCAAADAAEAELAASGKPIPWEQLKRELDLP